MIKVVSVDYDIVESIDESFNYSDIILDQNKYDIAENGQIISSGALHPCIAVGIIDVKTKVGFLLHESNAHYKDTVDEFIKCIKSKCCVDDISIVVVGGLAGDVDDTEYESVIKDRKHVLDKLNEAFPTVCKYVEWNLDYYSMTLNVDTDELNFKIECQDIISDECE